MVFHVLDGDHLNSALLVLEEATVYAVVYLANLPKVSIRDLKPGNRTPAAELHIDDH